MTAMFKELEKKTMKLSVRERALLAEHLLETIDDGEDIDSEDLWLKEAEKRYKSYRAGKMSAKSVEEVFSEAYSKLK